VRVQCERVKVVIIQTARRLAQKQPPVKKCVTAYLSRVIAPKMDGAKHVTDTSDHRKVCDRLVYRLGRSTSERMCGPCGNKNPGKSKNEAW
jgi:hypothetical protein